MIDVINSIALRLFGFEMNNIGVFPAATSNDEQDAREAIITWALSRNGEAEALQWCQRIACILTYPLIIPRCPVDK